jgi:hypothetical protein
MGAPDAQFARSERAEPVQLGAPPAGPITEADRELAADRLLAELLDPRVAGLDERRPPTP